MKNCVPWLALAIMVCASPTHAATPNLDEIWAIVQRQQIQIDELKTQLAEANSQLAAVDRKIEATGDYLDNIAVPAAQPKTQIGGYGELHANRLDADSGDLDQIDFHRFVLFFGHEFSDRIHFFSELELEHSLTGEGAPGEVELEQAYVDFTLTDSLSAKTGLFLLPIGILNETHEPPTFYGVERNSVESDIIPSTWWEAGVAMSGHFSNGLSWDVAVHSGLAMPTTGSSAFRVRSGRQKVAEAVASDLAYTARLRYSGVAGLDLGITYQYQSDASQVSGDGLDQGHLIAASAIYNIDAFTLKGVYSQWNFSGVAVETAGADRQTGWYLEPSYRFTTGRGDWGVYGRYQDVDAARAQDQFTQNEVGLNYWPTDKVVFKVDYRQRDHDLASEAPRDFNGFDLGLGYYF